MKRIEEAATKGTVIRGLSRLPEDSRHMAFHAGTAEKDGQIVATGGRVLAITARGDTLADARNRAYAMIDHLNWPEGFCRSDIGWRALQKLSAGAQVFCLVVGTSPSSSRTPPAGVFPEKSKCDFLFYQILSGVPMVSPMVRETGGTGDAPHRRRRRAQARRRDIRTSRASAQYQSRRGLRARRGLHKTRGDLTGPRTLLARGPCRFW
jgi:hypothetical protein